MICIVHYPHSGNPANINEREMSYLVTHSLHNRHPSGEGEILVCLYVFARCGSGVVCSQCLVISLLLFFMTGRFAKAKKAVLRSLPDVLSVTHPAWLTYPQELGTPSIPAEVAFVIIETFKLKLTIRRL